jgi:hypothetical protein
MSTTESAEFQSIRRALKVCSLLLLTIALLQIPLTLVSLGRLTGVYHDMTGNVPLPAVFQFTNFLRNNMLFVLIAILLMFVLSLVITLRARSGIFLYVNCGVFFIGWLAWLILASAAQEAVRAPIEMLSH